MSADPNMPRSEEAALPSPPPPEIFDVSADSDAETAAKIRAAVETDETLRILGDGLLSFALELVETWGGPAGAAGAVAARLAREVAEGAIKRAAAQARGG